MDRLTTPKRAILGYETAQTAWFKALRATLVTVDLAHPNGCNLTRRGGRVVDSFLPLRYFYGVSLSVEERAKWRLRIDSASDRYDDAKRRVREHAIERLAMLEPDGSFGHLSALREESLALIVYRDLLLAYSRALLDQPNEP